MTRATSRVQQRFRAIAQSQRAVAAQAEALASLEEQVPNYLDSAPDLAVVVADTAIFENWDDPARCHVWLNAALREWLRVNESFNLETKSSIVYRYVVLPYPSALNSWFTRRTLIDTILLHLHVHLWHGVVCCVVFADPQKKSVEDVSRVLNFLASPANELLFDLPGFYRAESIQSLRLEGTKADVRLREIWDMIRKLGSRPLWLFYDEDTFGGKRLRGWRWNVLRQFYEYLYGPTIKCPGCNEVAERLSLDHIAPISRHYFQTLLNLRPLCSSCNSIKGAEVGEDPFQLRIVLPDELRTCDLEEMLRQPPSWLGKISRPRSLRDLLARDVGAR